jgi:hypothetical protein
MGSTERLGPKYPQAIQALGVLLDDVKRWYPNLSAEVFLRKFITKLEAALRPEERSSIQVILDHCLDIWMGATPQEVLNLLYPKRFGESGYDENVCPFIGCYQLRPETDPIKHMHYHIKEAAERVQSAFILVCPLLFLTRPTAEVVREQTAKN